MIARFLAWWRKQAMVEQSSDSLNRIAHWTEAVSGPPNPCTEGHVRLYVTYAAEQIAVVCSVCTANLPRPDWADCSRCAWFPIDGYLGVVHCVDHQPKELS